MGDKKKNKKIESVKSYEDMTRAEIDEVLKDTIENMDKLWRYKRSL